MRIQIGPKAESQLTELHIASGLDCNLTHYLNLLINEKHKSHIPQIEDQQQHGHSKKESLQPL